MRYEYATTTGNPGHYREGRFVENDDPFEPDGDGWEMVGAAATEARVYWFWRKCSLVNVRASAKRRTDHGSPL